MSRHLRAVPADQSDFQVVDPPVENGGGGGHDGDMRERLARLEAVLSSLATKGDLEGVRSDLHKMDASIVRWMLATVLTLFLGFAGLFFTMQNSITGALDRAVKASTPQVQQPASAPAPPPASSP